MCVSLEMSWTIHAGESSHQGGPELERRGCCEWYSSHFSRSYFLGDYRTTLPLPGVIDVVGESVTSTQRPKISLVLPPSESRSLSSQDVALGYCHNSSIAGKPS